MDRFWHHFSSKKISYHLHWNCYWRVAEVWSCIFWDTLYTHNKRTVISDHYELLYWQWPHTSTSLHEMPDPLWKTLRPRCTFSALGPFLPMSMSTYKKLHRDNRIWAGDCFLEQHLYQNLTESSGMWLEMEWDFCFTYATEYSNSIHCFPCIVFTADRHLCFMHFAHQAPAECACASLRNQDGGRPFKPRSSHRKTSWSIIQSFLIVSI
jgi:hypothetical protein